MEALGWVLGILAVLASVFTFVVAVFALVAIKAYAWYKTAVKVNPTVRTAKDVHSAYRQVRNRRHAERTHESPTSP